MSEALAAPPTPLVLLTTRSLLARVNRRIVEAKRMLRHRHDDVPYWSGAGTTAAQLQRDRGQLACVATVLHVERATARGRIHGARFVSLDEQRAWLHGWEHRTCAPSARLLGLGGDETLAELRAGVLYGPAEAAVP